MIFIPLNIIIPKTLIPPEGVLRCSNLFELSLYYPARSSTSITILHIVYISLNEFIVNKCLYIVNIL